MITSRFWSGQRGTYIVLALILGAGLALRLANLGGPSFGVDEILHVFPAQRLMAGDGPMLPFGVPYTRSLPYTWSVAWVSAPFGEVTEWTARLPSVLFGSVVILIVFAVTRQWYGSAAGLVAAGITAVAPMQIAFSRQARMYALFQLLYLIAIYLLFQAFETSSPRRLRWVPEGIAERLRSLEVRPALFVLAALVLVLAWRTHQLIVPALTGPAVYVLCMAVVAAQVRAIPAAVRWKYHLVAAVLLCVAVLAFALDFGSVQGLYADALTFAPTWAQGDVNNWRYYLYRFAGAYPTLFGTFVLASAFALTRNPKATVYVLGCFAAPFVLQSALFAWKSNRYLFHIMPLMFMIGGVALSAVASALYQRLAAWARRECAAAPRVVAGPLTAVAVMFLLVATPELREGIKLHRLNEGSFAGVQHHDWRTATAFIRDRALESEPIITSRVLLSRYYGASGPVYLLNNDEMSFIAVEDWRDSEGRLIESATGARVVVDIESLRDILTDHPSGWLMTERWRFNAAGAFPGGVADFVERHFEEVDAVGVQDLAVWRWPRAAIVTEVESSTPRDSM